MFSRFIGLRHVLFCGFVAMPASVFQLKIAGEFLCVFWNTIGDPTDKLLAITPSQGLVAEDMAGLSPAHQQVEPKTLA